MLSSDLSHAYDNEAPSAVAAVILNVAADGATADWFCGFCDMLTVLNTVSVAELDVVSATAVLELHTHLYCHPLNAY